MFLSFIIFHQFSQSKTSSCKAFSRLSIFPVLAISRSYIQTAFGKNWNPYFSGWIQILTVDVPWGTVEDSNYGSRGIRFES